VSPGHPAASAPAHVTAPVDSHGRGVLVVGVGGLGSPALSVLVQSGLRRLTLVDADRVDETNLQRQVLFESSDVGSPKVAVAAARLLALAPPGELLVDAIQARFTAENAQQLIAGHALVLEGADNYATKFLAADAAKLAGVPIVQAGAVRFSGWALASLPDEGACLRCVFEDIPRGQPETCAVSGVLGPLVGVLGALEASLAIQLLAGERRAASLLWSYDALRGRLRNRRVTRRTGCPLCEGKISALDGERYGNDCAA
jgi:molybdopterin/thiamine biosynthesis adenylyltransferase